MLIPPGKLIPPPPPPPRRPPPPPRLGRELVFGVSIGLASLLTLRVIFFPSIFVICAVLTTCTLFCANAEGSTKSTAAHKIATRPFIYRVLLPGLWTVQ